MIRRDFLGSLLALCGARFVKAEQVPVPPELPTETSGFLRIVDGKAPGYETWTITTDTLPNTHWITLDYNEHMKGEGINWHYTGVTR